MEKPLIFFSPLQLHRFSSENLGFVCSYQYLQVLYTRCSLWKSWSYFISILHFKRNNKRVTGKNHQDAYYIFSPFRVHSLLALFKLIWLQALVCFYISNGIATRVILIGYFKALKNKMELYQESITKGNLENAPICGS